MAASVSLYRYKTVNFEDPNYNIQLPVFSIHGNHDDPAGDGGLAALDVLSTANLINYFGKSHNLEKVSMNLSSRPSTCLHLGARTSKPDPKPEHLLVSQCTHLLVT